ncbi:MAG: acetyl-CoA carboxylase, carboxyltransferase subunit beta [Acidobacteriota bacterium]
MPWFRKKKQPKPIRQAHERSQVPEGLWTRCPACKAITYTRELVVQHMICPKCGYHFRIDPLTRANLLLDEGSVGEPLFEDISPVDALTFHDTKPYKDRLKTYQRKLGGREAVHVCTGTLESMPVMLATMDYRFMGGSMGSVVGERIARAAEAAVERHVPLLVVSASGGARMQEGALSLMQMAKISAALARVRSAGLPYISILTDPTTGGVTASFAMLGDINIAEPGALIGFAGPRVIEQTIRQQLPEGFQRSEFLLDQGFLDMVVPRDALKTTVPLCLRHQL